jgi:hypothetical protein
MDNTDLIEKNKNNLKKARIFSYEKNSYRNK